MSTFSEKYLADLRLTVLEILHQGGGETNLPILQRSIRSVSQHNPSIKQLEAITKWLDNLGLVHCTRTGASITAVTITARGEDVTLGSEKVDGIAPGGRVKAN